MRELVDAERIRRFMRELGQTPTAEARVYLTGGASAVLEGWRLSTVDIDLKIVPDADPVLRALPELKERLRINVELASPSDFIPELPGWEDRGPFIAREGRLSFHHYDFYGQALAKLERGHQKDLQDVAQMFDHRLIQPDALLSHFQAIEPHLYRFPAIDPASFRKAVLAATGARTLPPG